MRDRAADALALVREFHPRFASATADSPELDAFTRADAQLVVARRYGFPSWNRLRQHLGVVERYSRSPHRQAVGGPVEDDAALVDEFLRLACLVYSNDDPARWRRAAELLAERPALGGASLHAAAAAGDVAAAERLIAADPEAVRREGGPHRWEPLLYAAYTRVPATRPGQSTLEVSRLLLAHGADPNSGYLWEGLPSPFTALTGAFGRGEGDPPPHEHETPLATLLLEAGADPNDAQTIYNCSWYPGNAYLELLLRHGFGRGDGGPWYARLAPAHPTPQELAQDALIWSVFYDDPGRARLLVASGVVDVDGYGTRHPITGRRNPLALALSTGNAEIADLLLAAGAAPPVLDPVERLAAAAMRGDRAAVDALVAAEPGVIDAARAAEPGLIARAAEHGRLPAVRLLAELGFDVNHLQRKTALHEAAWRGDLDVVEALLELGADPTIADRDHHAPPAGWAEHNGKTEVAERLRRATHAR